MRKSAITLGLLLLFLCTSTAGAAFVYFENFEATTHTWTLWQQAGTGALTLEAENQTGATSPLYPLGNIQPESASNERSMHLNSVPSGNGNVGLYKVIDVPTGTPLTLDGYWRCHAFKRNSQWSEVIIYDGVKTITNGTDYNPGTDGSLANGEILYKIYSNNAANDTFAFAGSFSGTTAPAAQKAPMQYTISPLATGFQSTTGKLTVLLKFGHTSSSAKSIDWDDIHITPEPSTAALLAGGVLLLVRRRRTT